MHKVHYFLFNITEPRIRILNENENCNSFRSFLLQFVHLFSMSDLNNLFYNDRNFTDLHILFQYI